MHQQIERAAERYDLSQEENKARFVRLLRKHRVEELLFAAGANSGSSVAIGRIDRISRRMILWGLCQMVRMNRKNSMFADDAERIGVMGGTLISYIMVIFSPLKKPGLLLT